MASSKAALTGQQTHRNGSGVLRQLLGCALIVVGVKILGTESSARQAATSSARTGSTTLVETPERRAIRHQVSRVSGSAIQVISGTFLPLVAYLPALSFMCFRLRGLTSNPQDRGLLLAAGIALPILSMAMLSAFVAGQAAGAEVGVGAHATLTRIRVWAFRGAVALSLVALALFGWVWSAWWFAAVAAIAGVSWQISQVFGSRDTKDESPARAYAVGFAAITVTASFVVVFNVVASYPSQRLLHVLGEPVFVGSLIASGVFAAAVAASAWCWITYLVQKSRRTAWQARHGY